MLPAVTFLLVQALPIIPSVALGMLLVAACPGGNLSNLLTVLARGNGALSVSLTALATVVAVVSIPLNFTWWGGWYLESQNELQPIVLPVAQMLLTLLVVVGLPLGIGMAANRQFPRLVKRIRRPIRWASLLIFVAFIGFALAANFNIFLEYIHWLLLIVLAHNAIAYLLGYTVSNDLSLAHGRSEGDYAGNWHSKFRSGTRTDL